MKAHVNRLDRRQTVDPYVDKNLSYLFITSYDFCILRSRISKLAHKSIRLENCIHLKQIFNTPPFPLVLGFR